MKRKGALQNTSHKVWDALADGRWQNASWQADLADLSMAQDTTDGSSVEMLALLVKVAVKNIISLLVLTLCNSVSSRDLYDSYIVQ